MGEMRFRHIEVFRAIMLTGSVSAAAQKLNVSQPSVTRTLQAAEAELGYPLFDRIKGRLQPTDEGRALFMESERAYSALEDVRDLARRLRHGAGGPLRVAATPALGLEVLPEAVAIYRARHSEARFEISTQHSGDLLSALGKTSHGCDLGLTFGIERAPAAVSAVLLGHARVVCVARAELLADAADEVDASDLAGKPLIALDETEPLGWLLAERLRSAGVRPDDPVRAQTYHAACALAALGQGVAVVDAFTAASFSARADGSRLRVVGFHRDMRLPVAAAYSLARGLPLAARGMIDAFRESLMRAAARGSIAEAFVPTQSHVVSGESAESMRL